MSSSPPNFDPYLVLGVDKDAGLPEIKAAHRKLVLKCHPDKVKDESLRSQARDEFQRVQEAYELLSDEKRRARYDEEVRLAQLRKEKMERSSTKAAAGREYRDGRIYEERTPAGASYYDDDAEIRYSEEQRAHSRKHDDHARRSHSKPTEEKKKSKPVPLSTSRASKESKESIREHVKATYHDRAKDRTKERRRDFYDKYERTKATYVDGEDESSASSDGSTIYIRVKHSTKSPRSREPEPPRSKPEPEPSRESESRRYDQDHADAAVDEGTDDYVDDWDKFDNLQSSVKDYIERSKREPPGEYDRRPQFSRSPHTYGGYETSDWYEREAARYSSRTHRRTESARVATSSPPPRRSHERLDDPPRTYERTVPSIPTAPTAPKVSSSPRPPPQPTRSSTAPYPRSRREGSSRSESSTLYNMVNSVADTPPPRTKLRSADRNDSGYSSPGTPEMPQSSSGPKVNRYKIVDPPETITIEPQETHRYHRSTSPLRSDRPSVTTRTPSSKPTRSSTTATPPTKTYTYSPETGVRYEMARPAAASAAAAAATTTTRAPPVRVVYEEVRYAPEIKLENIQYAYPRYEDVRYTRQPAY